MFRKFRTKFYVGFALAILISIVSGITSYYIFKRQASQRVWVKETRHIIDSLTSVQKLLVDMETGRRGFRATNEKKFLEPYTAASQRIVPVLAGLKDSLRETGDDTTDAARLEAEVKNLMGFWQHNGDDASAYTREYITRLTDSEKKKMDFIRGIITAFNTNENKLLLKRRDEYDALIRYSVLSNGIGSILSAAIIITLVVIILREFGRRAKVQNELKASEEQLKNALEKVAAINSQLERFVHTVAHDIKSPLASITGALTILEMDDRISEIPELASITSMSAQRLHSVLGMVDTILEYSRVAVDEQHTEDIATADLINSIAALLAPPANIHISITGSMPVVHTRRIKLGEVFQNLISNAIKYNDKQEGRIEIGCKEKEQYYEFYVKDNGKGIPQANIGHIFSLFRDNYNQARKESSTGFGLNITRLIVEEQGGRIWVTSQPGEGSTFYFEWRK